jgi:cytoskeleton protein RodZ
MGAMDEKKDIPTVGEASPPQEAVQDLKALREARGLSLQDIFEMTRVSLDNLTAVEHGDFKSLPPAVYARNFIRKYARAVGIDEKPILDHYEKHLEKLNPPIEETKIRKPWPEADRRYPFLFMSLAAVIVSGILVSALFLYDQAGIQTSPAPTVAVESLPAPAAPAPENIAAVPASPAPEATPGSATPPSETTLPPASAAGNVYHLVLDARELTWIRITQDRNPAYQVLLKPGERIERMASDSFQLDVGNAGGVHLTFQGKPLGILGKQGQIIHMRLPEKGSERKSP